MLGYIQDSSDGFRILVRNSPVASATGTFSSLLNDIASQVEHILGREFALRGYDTTLAGLFSQSLAGMVALTGQWWLEVRSPGEDEVAAHLVNLAWTASAISCATSTVAVRRAGGPVRGALPPNGVSPGSRIRQTSELHAQ